MRVVEFNIQNGQVRFDVLPGVGSRARDPSSIIVGDFLSDPDGEVTYCVRARFHVAGELFVMVEQVEAWATPFTKGPNTYLFREVVRAFMEDVS
jgi:hypothetical protein